MQRRVASAVVVAVLAALAIVAAIGVAGFGSSLPQSPDELFEKFREYQMAGDNGKLWDLLTEDGRKAQIAGYDAHRHLLRTNDDPNETLTRNNFNCTREQFLRMSDVEIFDSQNKGYERALVDAKIVDRRTDPHSPDDMYLTIDTPTGIGVFMHVRHVSGGWRWVENRLRVKKS